MGGQSGRVEGGSGKRERGQGRLLFCWTSLKISLSYFGELDEAPHIRCEEERSDTAMTGEISLRGLVLPVGGIKEKVLTAARAGIKMVLLPSRNQKDLEDIPEAARHQLNFVWIELPINYCA